MKLAESANESELSQPFTKKFAYVKSNQSQH